MTGFEWSVIGAGPDPRLDGKLNALTYVFKFVKLRLLHASRVFFSYHTGVNSAGRNWHESTPDFVERHLNPYLEFVGTIFRELLFNFSVYCIIIA